MKRHKDKQSSLRVLAYNKLIPESDVIKIMVSLQIAFEKIKLCENHDAFDLLAAALNVGLVRARSIHQDIVAEILEGAKALQDYDLMMVEGRWQGFTLEGLEAIANALLRYKEIIQLSTYRQMDDALQTAMKEMVNYGKSN